MKLSKARGMARVNEGSHSFTCRPHVYPPWGSADINDSDRIFSVADKTADCLRKRH